MPILYLASGGKNQERNNEQLKRSVFLINFIGDFKMSELILKKILLIHKVVLLKDFLPKYSLRNGLRQKYHLAVLVYIWYKKRSARGSG